MKNRSSLVGISMVVIGIALIGFAAFEAFAPFRSNDVKTPSALSATTATRSTPSAPAVQVAANQPSATSTAIPSLPEPATDLPQETATLESLATSPAQPLAKPSGSMFRAVRIVIPAIHLDAPVVEMPSNVIIENGQKVEDWQVPKYQVGHAVGSANPGERDNVVMSAHNNLYNALFRKLYTLKPGDEITVYNYAGAAFLYRVTQSYIVQEVGVSFEQQVANAQVMLPTDDARLTLISCYPENNNTQRAIVIAQLLDLGQ